jgi:putative thioredoxin
MPTPPPIETFATDHEHFATQVLDASHQAPILVDFWADWCAPCHALIPHLNRVLEEYQGRLRLAKIEVDEGENMKIAGRYRVRGFPTVILFCAGEERGRFSGGRSVSQIRDWLEQHLMDCSPLDCQ